MGGLRLSVLTLIAATLGYSQGYSIKTFAGSLMPASIPGTSASIQSPAAVAVDAAGNLFFSDTANHAVLRLDAATGVMTVAAGNGTAGFSGDGGPAAGAQLNQPIGIALDAAGNLYIADTYNHRIRKVSNGVITTVAGDGEGCVLACCSVYGGDNGPAALAKLAFPMGVTVGPSGDLYIADTNNSRIRKVSNGVITTVAGNGATVQPNGSPMTSSTPNGDGGAAVDAQLFYPEGVAVAANGDLYIADTDDYRIRKVTNGIITTIAGTGYGAGFLMESVPALKATLDAPSSVALDAAGNLYIADQYNSRIRMLSNGTISTVGIGALTYPQGIALDPAGNLYIADTGDHMVLEFASGRVSIMAGGNGAGYSGDNGPAAGAMLNGPQGVAVDGEGSVYIVDSLNMRVRKVTNGTIATAAGNGACGFGDNRPATGPTLCFPSGAAADSAGNFYVGDNFANRVYKVTNGQIATVAGSTVTGAYAGDGGLAISAELNMPYAVAADATGEIYLADFGNNRVRRVSNGVISTVAGDGSTGYSGDGGLATAAGLKQPSGVAVDQAGNLYIADSGNNRIRKVSNGVITTVAGSGQQGYGGDGGPAASAELNQPSGVAVDASGNLYIADTANQRIRKVSGGVIMTIAGNGSAGFGGDGGPAADARLDDPSALAVDARGNIYIADTNNNRVRVLTPPARNCAEKASLPMGPDLPDGAGVCTAGPRSPRR